MSGLPGAPGWRGIAREIEVHDVTGDLPYPAICECDGLPIDPVVAGYIP